MFTVDNIQSIKDEAIILETLKVVKSNGDTFDVFGSFLGEEKCIHTGKADSVSRYLNGYFDLKTQ